MLRLSQRPGVTETYTLCPSHPWEWTLLVWQWRCCFPAQQNCIFKHEIQPQIKRQRIFVSFSSALICITLYPQLFHPPTSTHMLSEDLARRRSLYPWFAIKESCGVIELENKMVAWYSDSFPWLQTAGTDWEVKIFLDCQHGRQAPSCGWGEVPPLSRRSSDMAEMWCLRGIFMQLSSAPPCCRHSSWSLKSCHNRIKTRLNLHADNVIHKAWTPMKGTAETVLLLVKCKWDPSYENGWISSLPHEPG